MDFPYLNNRKFLSFFDKERHKIQYIKIIILDFQTEKPLASIEGKSTGGSCNLSGTSNMRRTASCTLVVDPEGVKVNGSKDLQDYTNLTEIENLISLNKKVKIFTGFKNTLKYDFSEYSHYDIIWFPLGTYVIKTASVSNNNSGINISLSLNDKTALLNGDMGGIIPAATVFSESEIFNAGSDEVQIKKVLLKDIIKKLVIEFGGEDPNKVIVTDVPDTIVKVMKWCGEKTLYFYTEGTETLPGSNQFSLEKPTGNFFGLKEYLFGQDVGYVIEDFVYPGLLECKAGESVAAMLDKIKNALGNYEWFYDLYGFFHFQEKKNYLNISQATNLLQLKEEDYLSISNYSKSIYTFDKERRTLITSFSNSPQYQNIKNDFIVWGSRETATGTKKPLWYHLAFDQKPIINEEGRFCIVYEDYRKLQQAIILKKDENFKYYPEQGDMNNKELYYLKNEGQWTVYHWDEKEKVYRSFPEYEVCKLKTNEWRTELYFRGLEANNKTFAVNYYSAELNSEWPKIYNIKSDLIGSEELNGIYVPVYMGKFNEELDETNYSFWIDFLEGSQGGNKSISQFNVNKIGRRTKVSSDSNANCIFSTEIPNYILIEADGDVEEEVKKAESQGRQVIQVSSEIFKNLGGGGTQNAAFEKIKELLYQHTNYNESISLSVIPIYHLEPNNRITVFDKETGISGDYLISTISLPLAINGTSNIAATRCLEKTF